MTCTAWESAIDAYMDDDLDRVSTRRLEAHLAACASCRALVDDLRAIQHEARALPTSIQPTRDLWPGIEQRLGPQPATGTQHRFGVRPWRNGILLAAAAAILLLIGTWAVSQNQLVAPMTETTARGTDPGSTTGGDPAGANQGLAVMPVTDTQGAAGPAVAATRDAASRLRATVETRWAGLTPATRDVLERNLTVIDQAIQEIEGALATEPEDRGLQSLLLASYRQQISLLERLVDLG